MEESRFFMLMERYVAGTLDPQELPELETLLGDDQNTARLGSVIDEALSARRYEAAYNPALADDLFSKIMERSRTKRRGIVFSLRRVAAAACVILLGTAAWFFVLHRSDIKKENTRTAHDVAAPVTAKAILQLSDGTKVNLDSMHKGSVATQGNISVIKTDNNQIAYQPSNDPNNPSSGRRVGTNILTNPRGSKVIDITLSDGSRVWLNAESSIKYPVIFDGSERNVEITGEAYFEVAHNAKKPFKVRCKNQIIEDIGTSFNVNGYANEDATRTTLVEGAIDIRFSSSNNKQAVVLKPGQQAVVSDKINVSNNIDIDEVMAWKNGLFQFNKTDTRTVMRQLERWYDIEVKYKGAVPEHAFVGQIDRNLSLVKVLHILSASGLQFTVEGNVLTIL